ncbi:MAG: 3'-5' exonuclease [Gammaproteobacteria bacterium]|nr:3'-5' exonuclease [Gammaproteobacteria bacterium]
MSESDTDKLDAYAQKLSQHADYRVVRRYRKPELYSAPPEDRSKVKTGIYLDVETTGLDYQSDHIIELAMVKFEFSSDGQLYRLGPEFDELNDPGVPIPPEITRITGITDEMVAGKVIEPGRVYEFIDEAAIIIAHNAGFDRKFVEASYAGFADKAWACSARQVPWREAGFESAKLEYLAYRQGFFYDGHRAANDCLAGIHVLSVTLESLEKTAFAELLERARAKDYRLWATNSPFESKDLLKARGYRWNNGDDGRPKSWFKDIPGDELDDERAFLADKVYGEARTLPMEPVNAFNRFSARI